MHKVNSMLKHLRIPNLLIMAFVLYSVRYFLMAPILESNALHLVLSHLDYFLFALSCLLIAAAGYVINDYYDQEADTINKPNKKLASPERALNVYAGLNIAGIGLAAFVGWRAGLLNLAIIHIIITFLLWKYAESWKGVSILGHMVVSTIISILIMLPLVYEYIAFSVLYRESSTSAKYLLYALLFYAAFSYLINFARELAKGAQDIKGDQAAGYQTFAVKYGPLATKRLAMLLLLISFLGLFIVMAQQFMQARWFAALYTTLAVGLPNLLAMLVLMRAISSTDFRKAANLMKILMIGGIGSMAYFYLELLYF